MYYYLPSCNFTKSWPEASARIKAYLAGKEDVTVCGCCRPMQGKLTGADTFLTICQSCSAICREASPAAHELSIWEYLLTDPDFPWPDYGGVSVTIQDCFRARNKPEVQDAVRECMRRMHLAVVEIAENREACMFDGVWLMRPAVPRNLKIAPEYFTDIARHYIHEETEEAQVAAMKEWCSQYQTEYIAGYCNSCVNGICLGGAKGVHLMELMLGMTDLG